MERRMNETARSRDSRRCNSGGEEAPSGDKCCSPGGHTTRWCGSRDCSNLHNCSSGSSSNGYNKTNSSDRTGNSHMSYYGSGHLGTPLSNSFFGAPESSSSSSSSNVQMRRTGWSASSCAGDNGVHSCLGVSSSWSSATGSTSTAFWAGGVRSVVPSGGRRAVTEEEFCSSPGAFCSGGRVASAAGYDTEERECRWEMCGDEDTGRELLSAPRRRRRREGDDGACSSSSFSGETFFSNALLLWLLSPFLYLNELTKLRLLSKSLNARWLSLEKLRWMMCNSVALVFPAQWGELSQQCTHQMRCCSRRLRLPQPSPEREQVRGYQRRQQQQEQDDEWRKTRQERDTQQLQQHGPMQGEQDQQPKAHLEKRELQGALLEHLTERPEYQRPQQEWQQQAERKKQEGKLRVDMGRQGLEAEQEHCLRQSEAQHHQRVVTHPVSEGFSPVTCCVTTPQHSRAAPCGSPPAGGAAAAGQEALGASVGGSTTDAGALHGGSPGSRKRPSVFACCGNNGETWTEAGNSVTSAASNASAQDEGEAAAGGASGSPRSRGKERQAEACGLGATAAGAEERVEAREGRVPAAGCSRKAPSLFRFLQAVLLRSPSHGCGALQLRQLTLHMPESPDAVLSLPQFKTYKTLLELCSPTLEELCLIDFASFYAVVDVSPALQQVLQTRGCSGEAAACGVSAAAKKDLGRALAIVKAAFQSLSHPFFTEEDDEAGEGETPAGFPTVVEATAQSRGDLSAGGAGLRGEAMPAKASAGEPQGELLSLDSPQQLTLTFKIWENCRLALEEDITDDDEIKTIDGGSSDDETGLSTREIEGARVRSCWSVNSFGVDLSPSAAAPISCPSRSAVAGVAHEGPAVSDALEIIAPAAPAAAEAVTRASSLHLTELPAAARQHATLCAAGAEHLPSASTAAPPTTEESKEERATDSTGAEAPAAVDSTCDTREDATEATSDGGSKGNVGVTNAPRAEMKDPSEHPASATALPSVTLHGGGDLKALSVTGAAASRTAAASTNEFCRGGPRRVSVPTQCHPTKIPTGTDVYDLVHNTVRSLKLNCCFPQLKRVHVYGYSDWKVPRPYFSCLACLFLPRDFERPLRRADNSRSDNDSSGAETQDSRRSSRSTQRSRSRNGSSDMSRRNSVNETRNKKSSSSSSPQGRRSSSSSQGRSRSGCVHERLRRSSSGSPRQSHSRSRSRQIGSARLRGRDERRSTSSTPERRRREQSSGGSSVDSPRRRGRSPASRHAIRAGRRKGENDQAGDAASAEDAAASARNAASSVNNCRSASAAGDPAGKGGVSGDHADGTAPESTLSFPNLEELWWLDASCAEEDMCDFLLVSQTQRLKRLSFSTYSPSTVSNLLEKCITHPRLFKNLRELDIDGLDFIWPDDEWWWFSGNGWTRFVEIWMLHAMDRYHLAKPCFVPRTLQQLEAERRQQQRRRCRRQRSSAARARPHSEQQRRPNDEHRRHHRSEGRGGDAARWSEEVLNNGIRKLSRQCKQRKEDHTGVREAVCSGRWYDVEGRSESSEDTSERSRHTADTDDCAEEVARKRSCCGWNTAVEDDTARLSETTTCGACRERRSKNRRSDGKRGLTAKGAGAAWWCWSEYEWAPSTDEGEEESKSQQEPELPLGFVGVSSEVDYEGIKKALDRLPRVRKLRLLSFNGNVLGGPEDSTHTLGSFFPEADLEVQGSLFIQRRLLQRFLMKVVHKAHAAERRHWEQSNGHAGGRNVLRWGRASRTSGVSCSGRADGVKQRSEGRQRSLLRRRAFSSEAEEEEDSYDDSVAGPSLEFRAPPTLACSAVPRVIGSVTNPLVLEEPVASRTDVSPEWRRLTAEAGRVNPVGQQYVMRWLRNGLVYKVTMTLTIHWTDRAELRVDAFHRECVSQYVRHVLAGLPSWMRKKSVRTMRVSSLRILELADCIQETDKPLEGYEDAGGYFVPFGRVKDVLAYFTPFLLGLNCFSPFIPIQHGDTDDEGSIRSPAPDSGTAHTECEDHGHGDEDVTDAEEGPRVDDEVHQRSSRGSVRAEDEQPKVKQRRRTVHVDHDLAKSVYAAGDETGTGLQRPQQSAEESCGHACADGGISAGGSPRDTVCGLPGGIVESSASGNKEEQHERDADSEGILNSGRIHTVEQGSRESPETSAILRASGDARDNRGHAEAGDDVSSPEGQFPGRSLRVLRLKGVVGLALPLYTRFVNYRKLSDLVVRVARAYRTQIRVLLVTDSTILFYRHNKTHHDVALAALARDFKAVTKECMDSLQVIDYRVYRPITWRYELGENQEQICMPAFLQVFLRNNPQFRLLRRLDCISPVDDELEIGLQRVKTMLTAYIWIKKR